MKCHVIFILSRRRRRGGEKRSELQVYSRLFAGCNTDSRKK
jgi:hypothetical protein